MNYTNLPQNLKYDTLAAAIRSREVEHFNYNFDKTNFETMLLTLEDGPFKDEVTQRLADTIREMNKVEAIYNALVEQIDDQAAYAAAVARLNT